MAAPVHTIQVALNWSETAIEKDDYSDCVHLHYTKNSFYRQRQIQKSQEISNLCLASRAVRGEPQNEWAALGAAHEKVGKIPESQIMECIYDFARTHFIKNS